MRFVFMLFKLLFVATLFANESDSLRTEQRDEGSFVIHQVEEEETLYSLARRYKSTVKQIIEDNQIADNRIEIGQVLAIRIREEVPLSTNQDKSEVIEVPKGYHLVAQGETLYSISRKYALKVKDIKKWNDLEGNYLSPGMYLKVNKRAKEIAPTKIETKETYNPVVFDTARVEESTPPVIPPKDPFEDDPFEGFENYLVQTGETLYTIANKIGVAMDSLRSWNRLTTDYLKIGQQLWFRKSEPLSRVELSRVAPTRESQTLIDKDGFEKIVEEGVAAMIASMETSRYLALHRALPIGTNLEVRNLMNNRIVHVKVVGKLPDTGINKNLMLRLSKPAYDQLGILDSKSRVEVSYYK